MTRVLIVSAACLLLSAAHLQSQRVIVDPRGTVFTQLPQPRDGSAQEPPASGTGVIRGRVVVAGTDEPVRRAFVNLSASGRGARRSVSTDEQGRFEFRELAKGQYHLSATKGGFVTVQLGQRGPREPGRPIQLNDGEVYERAVIRLPRGGVIAGRISDEYGDPIADAMVTALQYRWTPGSGRVLAPTRPTQTNDLGQFRLHGLAPGEYVVSATYRGGMMMGGTEDPGMTGYAPTYYPGVPQAAEATSVSVRVGEETSADFQLLAMRLARIRGVVLDASGNPAGTDTMLMVSAKDGGRMGMMVAGPGSRVDADGAFTVGGLAPGVYRITASTRFGPTDTGDGDPLSAVAEVTVAGGDVDGVTLTLTPGATASGQVVIDGDPTAIRPETLRIMTRTPDIVQGAGVFAPPARVKEDLGFELRGLFGTRLLTVGGLPPNWHLKSVLLRGTDVTDDGFDADGARAITGLQVVVTDRHAVLTGGVTVRSGEPVTDFTVVVFPEDPARWTSPNVMRYIRPARADQEGRFRIEGLPAGRYLAIALEFADTSELGNPEVLEQLAANATRIDLADGENRTVQLRLAQ